MGTRKIVALRPARKEGPGDAPTPLTLAVEQGEGERHAENHSANPRRRRPLHRSRPGWVLWRGETKRQTSGGEEYIEWKPLPAQFPRDN